MLRTIIAAAFVAIVLASASSASSSATVAHAEIGPYTTVHAGVVIDAGVTAHAQIIATASGRVVLRVVAEGLVPGGTFAVHVHDGVCTDYLGHHRYDPAAPGTRDNEIWLDLDANAAGRAVDEVQVAPFALEQPLSLVIHQHSNPDVGDWPPGPRIACGNLELGG